MCPQLRSFDFITGKDKLIKRFSFGRHIHSVVFDIHTSSYYISIGDENYESAIIELDQFYNFKKYIFAGVEDSRVISIEYTKNIILFCTDKPYGQNYLYSYKKNYEKVSKVCSISGPVYSSCKSKSNFYFISSIENKNYHKGQLITFDIKKNIKNSIQILEDNSYSSIFFNYEKYYLYNLDNDEVVFKRNI